MHRSPAQNRAQLLRFLRALDAAESVRWEASPRPRSRDDVIRSSSEVSDPTAATALDPVRSDLSDLVRHCEAGLARLADAVAGPTVHLEAAVTRWEGKDD